MKNIILLLAYLMTFNFSQAAERAFRVERYYPTVDGYAIAWGIPGQKLDFEKLDKLSIDEVEKELDYSSVRNFIIDLETNQIIDTIENEDFVMFNIAGMHFGNHYSLSIDKLWIENKPSYSDTILITENFKWSNHPSKILLIDRSDKNELNTVTIDAVETFQLLHQKLKASILPQNMDLFENAASNLNKVEIKFIENVGEVMEFSFDYAYPKSEENSLEVVVQVRLKYDQGKIIPHILKVHQKQY